MRTLRLRKDVLTELSTADLAAVVGGSAVCGTNPCTLSEVKCISNAWSCTW